MNALQALENYRQRADKAYDSGHYRRAFDMYRDLATIGDKFSQYRLATMYESGLYVEPDPLTAYAWSYVAAETDIAPLREYHDGIKRTLNAEQLAAARLKAADLLNQYGLYANALDAKRMLRDELKKCTGSRTGSRCDRVSVTSFDCNASNDRGRPTLTCLRIGSMGLLSVAGTFPATLRSLNLALDTTIQNYQPGVVEFGDFELIDDSEAAPESKQSGH